MGHGLPKCQGLLFLLIIIFITLLPIHIVECYRRGDVVRTNKRSWFGQDVSPWTPLLTSNSPKFNYKRKIQLVVPEDKTNDVYKVAFSFGDDTFLTPWITVWDEERTLMLIEFVFTSSGDDIHNMWFNTYYEDKEDITGENEEKENMINIDKSEDEKIQQRESKTSTLRITYSWIPRAEADPTSGAAFILITAFIVTTIGFMYVIIQEQVKIIQHEMRKTTKADTSSSTSVDTKRVEHITHIDEVDLLQPQQVDLNVSTNEQTQTESVDKKDD